MMHITDEYCKENRAYLDPQTFNVYFTFSMIFVTIFLSKTLDEN